MADISYTLTCMHGGPYILFLKIKVYEKYRKLHLKRVLEGMIL